MEIYRQADSQGQWVACLHQELIGCIAGVRYSQAYGFIGLFIVAPQHRGRGYGLQLWRHALKHLAAVACVGLEAAPERIADYASWGFQPASPDQVVQAYDAVREPSPRPHFLRDWLDHPAGTVLALVDPLGQCHGFGRIRPCLLDRHPGVVLLDAPGANPACRWRMYMAWPALSLVDTEKMASR